MKRILVKTALFLALLLPSACGGTGPMNINWLDNAPAIIQDSREAAGQSEN